ncbi:MAG: hypothetical protein RB292_00105 [Patescibacteria group bacterium]|nr:hypothetical protein [Patescibacteria group bacterium]
MPLILIFSALILSQTSAQEVPVCNPDGCNGVCPAGCSASQDFDCSAQGCCGDNKVQSPNGEGKFEQCDAGSGGSESCTPQCGQKFLGWAWADNFGWLSLNSDNCLDKYLEPDFAGACGDSIDYFVQADSDNNVRGWAWSDLIGWVCFGVQCDSSRICEFTPGGSCPDNLGDLVPPGGWQAQIIPDGTSNPKVVGWAKAVSLGDQGWFSLNCANSPQHCAVSNYAAGVAEDDFSGEKRLTLTGWAWNSAPDGFGLGWLKFNPSITTISPWLQTKYGDIYARGGLTSSEEPPSYNATYRILSGGAVTHFLSARGNEWIDSEFGFINFPTPATRYSNVLGEIDFTKLICLSDDASRCTNSYGFQVERIVAAGDIPSVLGGKVYYRQGDLTINSPKEFLNAAGFTNAAGTIVVNGDLIINANLTYDPTDQLTRFRNLASVAWIVKGDLKISPLVTELAGNFIVLGNGDNNCLQDAEVEHCGQIYTCYNSTDCQTRLTVSGLMMARKFYLKREFPINDPDVTIKGSEIIIYDGRLLANTPPGLADFAQALPIWRSETFSL